LSIDQQFLSLNPCLIKSFRVFFENSQRFSGNFDFNAFGIKRSKFDSFLLDSVKSKGIKVIQPGEVKEIYKEREIFELKVKQPEGGEIVLKTNNLIAAYGKQNSLDLKLKRSFSTNKTGFNGIKYHVSNEYFNSFEKNEIHIYAGKNIYCGINYVDHETVTLCLLQKRMESEGSFKQHLLKLFNSNKNFNRILKIRFFEEINYQKIYGTGNIYFGRRNKVENGIFMIGDAAGVISPFSGDGIGMAFDSAKLVAEILLNQEKNNKISRNSIKVYEKKWEKLFGSKILISRILQNFLLKSSYKKFAWPAIDILHRFPSFSSIIVRKTRS
jgi:flavin-dependent dehydrogenase